MGGGHHITRDDYDIDLLVDSIMHFKTNTGWKYIWNLEKLLL